MTTTSDDGAPVLWRYYIHQQPNAPVISPPLPYEGCRDGLITALAYVYGEEAGFLVEDLNSNPIGAEWEHAFTTKAMEYAKGLRRKRRRRRVVVGLSPDE